MVGSAAATARARSRQDANASRAERIAAAQATLEDAVAAIQSGDDWQRYLELQSRLHAYSANNILLIAAQHAQAFEEGRVPTPVPTYVAGFSSWKALGRSVEKGQRGYAILAPLRSPLRVATSESGTRRVLARSQRPEPGEQVEARTALRGFTVEHVFAAEQTTGAELPTAPLPHLLEGNAPTGLEDAITALVEATGFTVGSVADAGAIDGANGRTSFVDKTVVIRADMDDAARVKTLLHEAAHVLLHQPMSGGVSLARNVCEVEAESVAFVVASVHGMATNDYSFPYVAAWAGEAGTEVVRASANRIAGAARQLIESSPASHGPGGRVPGVDLAIEAARHARQSGRADPGNSSDLRHGANSRLQADPGRSVDSRNSADPALASDRVSSMEL